MFIPVIEKDGKLFTPEGSQLNSSHSGDISTINFYDNRPRTHQERCLRRGERGGEFMVMGWGKYLSCCGFFFEPCSKPCIGQKRWLCQKYYYGPKLCQKYYYARNTTMTEILLISLYLVGIIFWENTTLFHKDS